MRSRGHRFQSRTKDRWKSSVCHVRMWFRCWFHRMFDANVHDWSIPVHPCFLSAVLCLQANGISQRLCRTYLHFEIDSFSGEESFPMVSSLAWLSSWRHSRDKDHTLLQDSQWIRFGISHNAWAHHGSKTQRSSASWTKEDTRHSHLGGLQIFSNNSVFDLYREHFYTASQWSAEQNEWSTSCANPNPCENTREKTRSIFRVTRPTNGEQRKSSRCVAKTTRKWSDVKWPWKSKTTRW